MAEQEGCCGGRPCGDMPRRVFLKTTVIAAGALPALGAKTAGAGESPEDRAAFDAWRAGLLERGERRRYAGPDREHIRFPLGGIGAGQILLDGHGRLRSWQIVNNFNEHAEAPGSCFALWARSGDTVQARVLEARPAQSAPGVPDLVFSGEYPFAWIDYGDANTGLPLTVGLEAYTPMVPLDEAASGLPCAIFHLDVENRGGTPVDVAGLCSVPNLAGWDGYENLAGAEHPMFPRNQNRARGNRLLLGPVEGKGDRLEDAVEFHADDEALLVALRRTAGVRAWADASAVPPSSPRRVLWLHRGAGAGVDGAEMDAALKAVEDGAALIISGGMLDALAGGPEEVEVFADFEGNDYGGWEIEGEAFGAAPARGTLPHQNPVSGYLGEGLVNTFLNGDGATGVARSREFIIVRGHMHLLVGGGAHGPDTCVQLIVDGDAVLRATGRNEERLRPVHWDLGPWRGRTARVEIVDRATGGWGHINVDHIVLSDSAASPFVPEAVAARLRAALPLAWERATPAGEARIRRKGKLGTVPAQRLRIAAHLRFEGARAKANSRVLLEAADRTPLIVTGTHGKGRVVLVNGDPATWGEGEDRQAVLGALLALAGNTDYRPASGLPADHPHYGTMALEAAGGEVSACPQWSAWETLWEPFARDGALQPGADDGPSAPGATWFGALAVQARLAPGERRRFRFTLAWHFPNRMRDARYGWGPPRHQYDHRLGNRYNLLFKDAGEVIDRLATDFERLDSLTRRYHAALYDTSLPRWLVDAISANSAIIRSPVSVWLEDGTFGGFEGSDACCPLNCTHVYNYAMTMAHLFPALERNVRETDLLVQMHPEEHFIPHRTVVPLGEPRLGNAIGGPHHHALDGELGTLLKTHREWLASGDAAFLERVWPSVAKVMRHVLRDHDTDGTGVIRGEQPNTYDIHTYGSNTFIGTLYLAALRAVAEMADRMEDSDLAEECRARFRAGSRGYDKACWNGGWFVHNYDAPGRSAEDYEQANSWGPGCHADQLLGQWWAHLLDLGHVLPQDHVRAALASIDRHNWRAGLAGHTHQQRVFAEGAERGLLNCVWPDGGRPRNPVLYCDEVWTGIEYQVAATMLFEGMVEPALRIARAARDRYTGGQRNPWSEIECGGFYARAMACWSMLHAAGGYAFNAADGTLRVAPNLQREGFRAFFIGGGAWGSVHSAVTRDTGFHGIEIQHGELTLNAISFPQPDRPRRPATSATVQITPAAQYAVEASGGLFTVRFAQPLRLAAGDSLLVRRG